MTEPVTHQDKIDEEEDYYLPLTDQRVFGAGLKRKRIAFVPASGTESSLPAPAAATKSSDVGTKYLSIVLGRQNASTNDTSTAARDTTANLSTGSAIAATLQDGPVVEMEQCSVCNMPLGSTSTVHESSIAHQLCLAHSHPPSHLDRQRKGLKYLQEYGWDPDSRVGLGARGEGIHVPVKANEKRDTTGLGLQADRDDEYDEHANGWVKRRVQSGKKRSDQIRVVKLNAKEVRKLEAEKKKKAEMLRGAFYGEDLLHYLGPGG